MDTQIKSGHDNRSWIFLGRHLNHPHREESLACREALALAQDLNLDQIVVACDCKTVMEEIKSGTEGRYSIVIKEIQARQDNFLGVISSSKVGKGMLMLII